MDWIMEHWKDILAIIGAAVSLATLIVSITPTQKDDALLAKIIKILAAIGLLNPDKSFIGTKKEEGK
jgi:Na+-transporting NADH:ubiquinone oxidoreductase subunit NqrC